MFINHDTERLAWKILNFLINKGKTDTPLSSTFIADVCGVRFKGLAYYSRDYYYDGLDTGTFVLSTEKWYINMTNYPFQSGGDRKQMFSDLVLFRLTHDLHT